MFCWCTVVTCLMVLPAAMDLCYLTITYHVIYPGFGGSLNLRDEIENDDLDVELGCKFKAQTSGNLTVAVVSFKKGDNNKLTMLAANNALAEFKEKVINGSGNVSIFHLTQSFKPENYAWNMHKTLVSINRRPGGIIYQCICVFDTNVVGDDRYEFTTSKSIYRIAELTPCKVVECSSEQNIDTERCFTKTNLQKVLSASTKAKPSISRAFKAQNVEKDNGDMKFLLKLNGKYAFSNTKHFLFDGRNNTLIVDPFRPSHTKGKVTFGKFDCSLYAWNRSKTILTNTKTNLEGGYFYNSIGRYSYYEFNFSSALIFGYDASFGFIIGFYGYYNYTSPAGDRLINKFNGNFFYVQPAPNLKAEPKYSADGRLAACKGVDKRFTTWGISDDGNDTCACVLSISQCNPTKTTYELTNKVDCVESVASVAPESVDPTPVKNQTPLIVILSVMAVLLFTTGIAVAMFFNRRKNKNTEMRVLTLIHQAPENDTQSAGSHSQFFDTEPTGDLTSTDRRKSDHQNSSQ